MPGGYANRSMEVDLTEGTCTVGDVDEGRLRRFIGGKGLGLSLLWELDTSEDPLDPGNPLIFLTGPLTGTLIQTSARSCLVTRSPLTGGFLDSHAGGHFGPALKRAGYDYAIFKGASRSPVYVHLTPSGGEVLDAAELWGKGCTETENILKERHERSRVASIGPAGENRVRFACITCDLTRNFGRGGAGAVMGSKNLKALVVQGSERIRYHDEARFKSLAKEMAKSLLEHPGRKKRYELGTMMWVRMGHEQGHFLPTRNFKMGQFDDYEKISSEAMAMELGWKHTGCFNCAIQCSKEVTWDGKMIEGPEYETTAYLGSGCMLSDPWAIAEANWLCNDLGLDTISTGVTISFAMEAAERGLLPEEDNSSIRFGSAEAVHSLIRKIANREGVGDVLAEGTKRAAVHIGKGSDEFSINIAGMELSGVNPLGAYSMLLALATADFASHTRWWSATDEMNGNLTLEGLPKYTAAGHDEINARNSLIVCDFLPYGFDDIAPFLEAATGLEATKASLMEVGERIHNLARLYNLRTGRRHEDDITLPGRFLKDEMFAGLLKGKVLDRDLFVGHVQDYYRARGWDDEGRPTAETLSRLGLSDM